MNENELRELDAWIASNVMGWKETEHPDDFTAAAETQFYRHTTKGQEQWRVIVGHPYSCKFHPEGKPFQHSYKTYQPTTDPAAAMEVMQACSKFDRNSYFASFHNFLMRPDHDTTFTPLQVCLFAKKLFTVREFPAGKYPPGTPEHLMPRFEPK